MHHGGKKHQSSVYLSKTPKVTNFSPKIWNFWTFYALLSSNIKPRKTRENSLRNSREICFSKKNFQIRPLGFSRSKICGRNLMTLQMKKTILCDWLMRGVFINFCKSDKKIPDKMVNCKTINFSFLKKGLLILWILFGLKSLQKEQTLKS